MEDVGSIPGSESLFRMILWNRLSVTDNVLAGRLKAVGSNLIHFPFFFLFFFLFESRRYH